MTFRETDFNWDNLWADLLKGAGRGLLVYDGSRLAQAALAGIDVFDDAQGRRRRREQEQASGGAYHDALLKLWQTMSPEEKAAFQRRSPEEQEAYTEEWAEVPSEDAPDTGYAYPPNGGARPPIPVNPRPRQSRPMSPNPIDGWQLQSISPFGRMAR